MCLYNIRAIRPLLWGAWAQGGKNRELNELLVAYAKSWRDAVMEEFDGKPRGIVPMMIMWDRQRSHAMPRIGCCQDTVPTNIRGDHERV